MRRNYKHRRRDNRRNNNRSHLPPKKSNLTVVPRKGESPERLIKRFIKKVKKEGIIEEVKERRFYIKPSKLKRIKKARAVARRKKEEAKRSK